MAKDVKDAIIRVRIARDGKRLLQERAGALGLTLSDYVRLCATKDLLKAFAGDGDDGSASATR